MNIEDLSEVLRKLSKSPDRVVADHAKGILMRFAMLEKEELPEIK